MNLTDFIDEDDGRISYMRLYAIVKEHGELIITIDKADEKAVRTGLSMRKARESSKLKDAGLEPGDEVLSYNSYPAKDSKGVESDTLIHLHITLGARKNVRVHAIKVPDDTF